jgi:hypothetical protein
VNLPFFPLFRSREVERIASLQDQVIELGTHVRFLEADKRVPQPRAPDGRFVSKRDIVADQLRQYVGATTPEQRQRDTEAFFAAAAIEAAKGRR